MINMLIILLTTKFRRAYIGNFHSFLQAHNSPSYK